MSLEEALMSVVPPLNSTWKKLDPIATDLRGVEVDNARPEEMQSHLLHPLLLRLVHEGKLQRRPAMLSVYDKIYSAYEYQRTN